MSDADKTVDDFQLLNAIANGHSSQVWEVRDSGGGTHAIKLLRPDMLKDTEQVNVLKHEAKVAQAVEHPTIIRVHRFVKTKTHCYMLMEHFNSPNLKSLMKSEPASVQARLARLIEQLTTALGHMHEKGWLHHDLKPDNILFSKSGDLKLIDFSLSMRRKGGLGTMVGGKVKVVQGTRTYIAPETIKKRYPTPQSDMYSLGITLYEILTGQVPFVASSPNDLLMKHLHNSPTEPSSYNPNVSPELDKMVLRLLAKKPENRPADMAEIAAEFRSMPIFKTDPADLARQEEEERQKLAGQGLDEKSRLDSRADAARSAAGIEAPLRPGPRMPSKRALELARQAGIKIPKHLSGEEEDEQPAEGQPNWQQYPGWEAYANQGYPQGYPQQQWPAQGQPAQQGYYQYQYQYPQEGQYPQQGYYPAPQQPAPSGEPPAPGQGGVPYQQPASPSNTPPPATPAPSAGTPEQPLADADSSSSESREDKRQKREKKAPPEQGRSDERHPTQADVDDPDALPLMEELPDVL